MTLAQPATLAARPPRPPASFRLVLGVCARVGSHSAPRHPFSLLTRSTISHLAENLPVNPVPIGKGSRLDLKSAVRPAPGGNRQAPTNSRTNLPRVAEKLGRGDRKNAPRQEKLVAFGGRLPRTPFEGPDLMRTKHRTGLIGLGKPRSPNPAFRLTVGRRDRRHPGCDHPPQDEPGPARRRGAARGPQKLATPLGQNFCAWPRTPGGRRFP